MKNINDIEELFSKSFENFEQEVNPSVWTNVQQAIQTPAAPSSAASAAGKGIALKYAAIAILSVATVTGAYFIAKEFNANQNETQSALSVQEEGKTATNNKTHIGTEPQSDLNNNSSEIIHHTIQTNRTETKTEKEINNEIKMSANSEKENTLTSTKPEFVSENNTVTAEKNKQNAEQKEQVKENTKETVVVSTFEIDAEVNVLEDYDNKTIAFSIENEVEKVEWNFGDGNSSSLLSGLHRYSNFGEYVVIATAWSKNGQKKSIKKTVNLQLTSSIDFVPNVITPNNDGSNDVFNVKLSNMQVFHLIIVDRFGVTVFETTNTEITWNGNDLNGSPCKNGTYSYVIKAVGTDNKTHNTNGTIQLLR
ncbi:MAG: gliding motility-associated C-terminal domain-containing protein [Flavobacteriales bacterium]|nr:gliding motility-associated C-terminal domain-containing protein [Flavobacteriales bacterium]